MEDRAEFKEELQWYNGDVCCAMQDTGTLTPTLALQKKTLPHPPLFFFLIADQRMRALRWWCYRQGQKREACLSRSYARAGFRVSFRRERNQIWLLSGDKGADL